MPSILTELSVEPLYGIPGVRAFARRADAFWRSTQIVERAWDGAVDAITRAGGTLSAIIPDWEAVSRRWAAFVEDARNTIGDALRWYRASARSAVQHLNTLIRELDEWLGFTATYAELREWVLRELRSFRAGPTLSERLSRTEQAAGNTLAIVAVTALAGLGAWGYYEYRKATATERLLQSIAAGGRA
ncbi:MAG TPA: hypothetical protein ENK57_07350 [Polyangiaceae bacterium]|nr:hypothetical protein [Polyangiaceae bacterium]